VGHCLESARSAAARACSPASNPMHPACSPASNPMHPACSPASNPMHPACSHAMAQSAGRRRTMRLPEERERKTPTCEQYVAARQQ
jgi:hypothetical protein